MTDLVLVSSLSVVKYIEAYDRGLCDYLESLGLPSAKVLAAIDDRQKVINNLSGAIDRLADDKRGTAFYISKLAAACSAGLFDAGLTYLWDAVVANLRERVARFDIAYFYDNAVHINDRDDYETEEDLTDLEDSKLISGCLKCGILTDVGYKHLDHIRDMRNWSSAAHPNNAEVGGLQLVGYLETCVKEVFAVEITGHAVVTRQLIRNLREQTLEKRDVAPIVQKVAELPTEVAASLLRAVVGMYSDLKQDARVIDNIRLLAIGLWKASPDEARHEVGMKYSALSVNAEIDRRDRVREFLVLVTGLTYLPEDQLALEIQEKATQLEHAHFAMNNFYNEPPLARELRKRIPSTGAIPAGANEVYVRTLAFCKIGRSSGIARGAEPIYDQLIKRFADPQIRVFVSLPFDKRIETKLVHIKLAHAFADIAATLEERTTNRTLLAPLRYIHGLTPAQIAKLANDSTYKKLIAGIV